MDQSDWVRELTNITLAPYISKARALISVPRRGGGNMFRHQMMTLTVLLDYLEIDSVLLKAATIHDIFEDAGGMPGVSREEIINLDGEGEAVYNLVMEVTRQVDSNGKKELKAQYLNRIMESGSRRAKILKLADRISNLVALGYVHNKEFVERTVSDTREYILPYAKAINPDMERELQDLLLNREHRYQYIEQERSSEEL
jgi:(p)ppGpp synthase/HD superfamily hydrolase